MIKSKVLKNENDIFTRGLKSTYTEQKENTIEGKKALLLAKKKEVEEINNGRKWIVIGKTKKLIKAS